MYMENGLIIRKIHVVDADTIKVRPFFGCVRVCRIIGIDCDEARTKRGDKQTEVARRLLKGGIFGSYVFFTYTKCKHTGGKTYKKDGYGRALVKVYVFRWWRYVNYSDWMKSKGHMKKGSKWNS